MRTWRLTIVTALFCCGCCYTIPLFCQVKPSRQSSAASKNYYNIGIQNMASGDFKTSMLNFDLAIQYDTSNGPAYASKGIAMEKTGDYKGAIKFLTQALALPGEHLESLYYRSACFRLLGDYANSRKDLDFMLENFSDSPGVHFENSLYYSATKDRLKALDEINVAIKLDPRLLAAYIEKAGIFLMMKSYRQSIDQANWVIGQNSYQGETFYYRGAALYFLNQIDSAILDLKRQLKVTPNHALSLSFLGLCASEKGKGAKCEKYFLRAIELDKTSAITYENWARAENHLRHFGKKKSILETAVAHGINSVEISNLLAESYMDDSDTVAALKCWSYALTIDSSDEKTHDARVRYLIKNSRYDAMLRSDIIALIRSAKDSLTRAKYYFYKAQFEMKSDSMAALFTMDKVVELVPRQSDAYVLRAVIWPRVDIKENADRMMTDLNRALAVDPKNYAALYFEAVIYVQRKDIQKSCEFIRRARQCGLTASHKVERSFCQGNFEHYMKLAVRFPGSPAF